MVDVVGIGENSSSVVCCESFSNSSTVEKDLLKAQPAIREAFPHRDLTLSRNSCGGFSVY